MSVWILPRTNPDEWPSAKVQDRPGRLISLESLPSPPLSIMVTRPVTIQDILIAVDVRDTDCGNRNRPGVRTWSACYGLRSSSCSDRTVRPGIGWKCSLFSVVIFDL